MTAEDERRQRIEQAKARAEAARRAGGTPAAPRQPFAETPTTPVASTPTPAATTPVATTRAPAATTREAPSPVAAGASRVIVARPDARADATRLRRSPEGARLQTRRSLLRSSFWAGLGVAGSGLLLGVVNFIWPRKVAGFGGVVTVPANRVPEPGSAPVRIPEGKFYLVNLRPGEGVPQPFHTYAAPSQSGGILALYQKCPHLGCTVPWRPEATVRDVKSWFLCPCHGSTYTTAGVRVAGPATRSMDTMAVTVNRDGSVAVDTASIEPGDADNPQRAVLP